MDRPPPTSSRPPAFPSPPTHYDRLGVHPAASPIEIRRRYRELSKHYHPDTTPLPPAIATARFQELNEAYAVLSNPERRMAYDIRIGRARIPVIRPGTASPRGTARRGPTGSSSAYLDPVDRPLSPGELFALLTLGLAFAACLALAIAVAVWRGDPWVNPAIAPEFAAPEFAAPTAPAPATAPSLAAIDRPAPTPPVPARPRATAPRDRP